MTTQGVEIRDAAYFRVTGWLWRKADVVALVSIFVIYGGRFDRKVGQQILVGELRAAAGMGPGSTTRSRRQMRWGNVLRARKRSLRRQRAFTHHGGRVRSVV